MTNGTNGALPLRQEAGLPSGVIDILHRACTSWLKNTEVTDLLVNHRQYGLHVSLEPPVRPPGKSSDWGSVACGLNSSGVTERYPLLIALLGGMYSPSSAARRPLWDNDGRCVQHACRPGLKAPAYPFRQRSHSAEDGTHAASIVFGPPQQASSHHWTLLGAATPEASPNELAP